MRVGLSPPPPRTTASWATGLELGLTLKPLVSLACLWGDILAGKLRVLVHWLRPRTIFPIVSSQLTEALYVYMRALTEYSARVVHYIHTRTARRERKERHVRAARPRRLD